MIFLSAVVVVVGSVAIFNAILTAGIVRRMRIYERNRIERSPLGGVPVGAALPHFASADGNMTDRLLRGRPAMIGFFSTDCPSCMERAPQFVARSTSHEAAGGITVAVILEGSQPSDELIGAIAPLTYLIEPGDRSGVMTRAFEVTSFPSFFITDAGGTVQNREIDKEMELALFGR